MFATVPPITLFPARGLASAIPAKRTPVNPAMHAVTAPPLAIRERIASRVGDLALQPEGMRDRVTRAGGRVGRRDVADDLVPAGPRLQQPEQWPTRLDEVARRDAGRQRCRLGVGAVHERTLELKRRDHVAVNRALERDDDLLRDPELPG